MQDVKGTERCDCDRMSGAVKTMKVGGGVIPIWQKSKRLGDGTLLSSLFDMCAQNATDLGAAVHRRSSLANKEVFLQHGRFCDE